MRLGEIQQHARGDVGVVQRPVELSRLEPRHGGIGASGHKVRRRKATGGGTGGGESRSGGGVSVSVGYIAGCGGAVDDFVLCFV